MGINKTLSMKCRKGKCSYLEASRTSSLGFENFESVRFNHAIFT